MLMCEPSAYILDFFLNRVNIYMVRTEVNKQPFKMHWERALVFPSIVTIWLATNTNSGRNVIYISRRSFVSGGGGNLCFDVNN